VLDLLKSVSAEISVLRREVAEVKARDRSTSDNSETVLVPETPESERGDTGHGLRDEETTPNPVHKAPAGSPPDLPMPHIIPSLGNATDTGSTIMDTDATRQEKWNSVVGAVKDGLSTMVKPMVSPRKERRIPDKLDPEPRAQPVRMPLHPAIKQALEACQKDIRGPKSGDLSKDTPRLNPDRQAPRSFFKPEGDGDFFETAQLDPAFKELHKGAGAQQPQFPNTPNMVAVPEAEYVNREGTARVLLCIESVRRWIEDAAIEAAEAMEKSTTSTLTLDRLTTELANAILTRRDMWLRTLTPRPRGKYAGQIYNLLHMYLTHIGPIHNMLLL